MRRASIIGTGLVGASIGLALRRAGWHVRGHDRDTDRSETARRRGALDESTTTAALAAGDADLVVVAVPVAEVPAAAMGALDAGAAVVTDVGSVKAPIVEAVRAGRPRTSSAFVGGHPMAGSEQGGPEGADADLFVGATWVLTPTDDTQVSAFTAVRAMVADIGAEVIAMTPAQHDEIVAVVSHVPQLAASTLMDMAASGHEEHATLLRLAAGGFRDMTRIAAGDPGIWPDICVANREAIVEALDAYRRSLDAVRALVADGDRSGLLSLLERARHARRRLPTGAPDDRPLVELRVPVPDHPGVLAEVATLPASLGVNVLDFEIAHSVEGGGGVFILTVEAAAVAALGEALDERGYRHSATPVL